ncbi:dihydrodipicolinate synthase family protein [Agromyces sp. CFH 90414]|uniref:Dihydrodipicolinate synthase family protein n=1 Tax=Agromyces agglutinans TaxID=2662258 RepID=A0A6I2F9C9_9MICO|nr:dihydrodipicolinate synthase family protein [Agromyces agglutinans]MRG60377.1 dihydrodipicolinate synthase family protein [Agromyces agglutinans]
MPTSGPYPVMLTPYAEDGTVDFDALDRYTDWLIEHGSGGLFPVALSGEMYDLSDEERLAVAARVVARAAGRVPVAAAAVAAGGADDTAAAVGRMAATEVDVVVLVTSVALAEGDDERMLRTAVDRALAAVPGVAFGIYECPLPYHRLLSDDTVAWLAATGRFTFFKETSHDVDRMAERVRRAIGTPMRIYNAGIENLAESVAVGVTGMSGWIANVYPDAVAELTALAEAEGLTPRVLELQRALTEAEQRMGPTYPSSAKRLVRLRSGIAFGDSSRWRPAPVDGAELERVLAEADAAIAGVRAR